MHYLVQVKYSQAQWLKKTVFWVESIFGWNLNRSDLICSFSLRLLLAPTTAVFPGSMIGKQYFGGAIAGLEAVLVEQYWWKQYWRSNCWVGSWTQRQRSYLWSSLLELATHLLLAHRGQRGERGLMNIERYRQWTWPMERWWAGQEKASNPHVISSPGERGWSTLNVIISGRQNDVDKGSKAKQDDVKIQGFLTSP